MDRREDRSPGVTAYARCKPAFHIAGGTRTEHCGTTQEAELDTFNLFLEMDVSLAAILPHREAILAFAADRLAERADMEYEDAKAALNARERLGATALGNGIAMPHALTRACVRPACALIGLSSPVDFDAPDEKGVDVVLALIWPQSRAQEFLKLSSTINRILPDPALLQLIRGASSPERIRSMLHARARADRQRMSGGIGDVRAILCHEHASVPYPGRIVP